MIEKRKPEKVITHDPNNRSGEAKSGPTSGPTFRALVRDGVMYPRWSCPQTISKY